MEDLKHTGRIPELYLSIPSWAREGSVHHIRVRRISPEAAAWAADKAKERRGEILFQHEQRYGNGKVNGQKNAEGEKWIDFPISAGVWIDEDGRPYVVKHSAWWREEDRNRKDDYSGKIPEYAKYPIGVVRRDLQEERLRVDLPDMPEAVGCEMEFSVAFFDEEGSAHPVDIQSVIEEVGRRGIPVSIEGWVSQLEIPSKPKRKDLRISDHRRELLLDTLAVLETLQSLNCWLLPVAVMPFSPAGQANFESTHVRNVLITGMSVAYGRELSTEEAAEILGKYAVNGLHITVNLKEDEDGFVGDERLKQVFEYTHTPISILLKALTLSGNLGSIEDLKSGRLSYRDIRRMHLPTTKVGRVRRLYEEEVIQAVEEGLAPSLERASLCDEDGKVAMGVHNPIGRQKESGRNEFTAFDVEPNVDKKLALESLMSLFTTVVDRALLKGRITEIYQDLDENDKAIFGQYLSRQDDFIRFSEAVEMDGLKALVRVDEGSLEETPVSEIILRFIDWVRDNSLRMGIVNEEAEEIQRLEWLKDRIIKSVQIGAPDNFRDYFDPESPYYALGTISEIAKKRFEALLAEGYEEAMAYNQILKELAEEYKNHLYDLLRQ